MKPIRIPPTRAPLALAALFAFIPFLAWSQALPLEIRQTETPLNHLSPSGKPLSNVVDEPPGSDGRLQTPAQQAERGLTSSEPTVGQFQGFVSLGGVVPTQPSSSWAGGDYPSYAAYAQDVLPHGGPVANRIHIARAQVGAPYISRRVELLFGSLVSLPEVDIDEEPLDGVPPEEYWQREPYWEEISGGKHVGAPYYWSRHARAVFANRPGPIEVAWRRTAALVDANAGDYAGDPNYAIIDGRVYPLLRQTYLVSGSPVKPPRRLYWTEESFRGSGVTIDVPEGVTINFVFTDLFPQTVVEAYEDPGSSPPVAPGGGGVFTELRTVFYNNDTRSIHAFNWQGRIFLELLGDVMEGDRRQHLGFEIVDVVRRINPADVMVELGEHLTAWPGGVPDDSHLAPRLLSNPNHQNFVFQHFTEGRPWPRMYAIRETRNLNDFLMHWMEEGLEGLRWPHRFVRYAMVWPGEIGKYSHYMRPPVATEQDARDTAIEMPMDNVPIIEYQDPLDQPRGKLTETFAFYTWLTAAQPAHRTLLRFTSGEHIRFERVFSWYADHLEVDGSGNLRATGTLAQRLGLPPTPGSGNPPKMLDEWNPVEGQFDLTDVLAAPRVIEQTVAVAQRLEAPGGEVPPKPGEPYWAGHIRMESGDSFNPFTYQDPFIAGFEAANQGAIIPVNAIPGQNQLEVWWFRSNQPTLAQGFRPVYWPSVIGHYTIEWPSNPREIVLASNHGSGPLVSHEAAGHIYVQNDPDAPGYNPNEEHALMIGGQAYALRDDLNLTDPLGAYSSEPFVLLQFIDPAGRPDMVAFRVLREKPEAGWVFDYIVEAGTILQAPMPLPLLPNPVTGIGANAFNFNLETMLFEGGDLPGNWSWGIGSPHPYFHYNRFTFRDRKDAFWVYRGLHAGPPVLQGGTYDSILHFPPGGGTGPIGPPVAHPGFFPPVPATAVVDEPFTYFLHASRRLSTLHMEADPSTPLPSWLNISGLSLFGTPSVDDIGTHEITLRLTSSIDNSSIDLEWTLTVATDGPVVTQGPLTIESTNTHTGSTVLHVGRPPYLAADPEPHNSFTMHFYYLTQEGFAFPGQWEPPVGTVVPYLPQEENPGGHPLAPVTLALPIVYRPVWPADTPRMRLGDTLMTPKEGLPAIRGQTSVRLLYQQSIARDFPAAQVSAVLHDPTREKEAPLADFGMEALPGGVRRELYQGRYYFPNLPPHLVERLYMDPFRGEFGHLVFRGELVQEVLGSDWLMLNVLRGSDLQTVKNLCPAGDPDKLAWDEMVDGLVAVVETFHENPDMPGDFIPNPSRTVEVGIGDMVEIGDHNTAVDSYALSAAGPGTGYVTIMAGGGAAFTPDAEPVSLHIIYIEPVQFPGDLRVVAATNPLSEQLTMQHSADLAGRFNEYEYEWRIAAPVNGLPPPVSELSQWFLLAQGPGQPRYTLGGANIRTLSDNYLIMRYRPLNPAHPLVGEWSAWTSPMLAEGWIKRVLAGINPFQQRITDLFNNAISTDVSMLTQAGPRWEGDIALNLENINDFGLIEIYETVLRRGRMLSIEAGINYGPANDALLLAAGYLNDLYMFVGNEAWADAANPTIGIGTANQTYGDIATSLFAFKGQMPNLLEEELALLRGRDDFLLPGTGITPVYNRLIWNYTRGIDAGEVIYAINYNIQEKPDGDPTGIIDASDAARMYPQGHGDAYGHYLTALKGYYSLLMNPNFDWVPRIEAVLLLGQPVSVDYFDERKFAAAAAAVARAGRHTFDLTWRRDYHSDPGAGWEHFATTRENTQTGRTRHWGMDHWATRTGQGAYVNWIVGNAILPEDDSHREGIQRIDRTTVPELIELPVIMEALQSNLSNAEAGLTPLGIPEGGLAFDIDPSQVAAGRTHFEQIYDRTLKALNNAVAAFDDAKDVTRLMRSEEDSLAGFQTTVAQQEHAYRNRLIEIYGTPYPDDIGPGRTYVTGYAGPDLLRYMYVDLPELPGGFGQAQGNERKTYRLDIQTLPADWRTRLYTDFNFFQFQGGGYILDSHFIEYELGPHGFFDKPSNWTGRRRSPGQLQQAISEVIAAHHALAESLRTAQNAHAGMERKVSMFQQKIQTENMIKFLEREMMLDKEIVNASKLAWKAYEAISGAKKKTLENINNSVLEAIPTSLIAGLAAGGDLTAPARGALIASAGTVKTSMDWAKVFKFISTEVFAQLQESTEKWTRFEIINNQLKGNQQLRELVTALGADLGAMRRNLVTVNERLRALDDAERKYRALLAEGDRVLEEREIFRRRAAAVIQGYRTRDAAFRIFRNEKLERYQTLFELAARYTYLAAQAYDYETGLLHTPEGRAFVDRIIAARALGVVSGGEPQFAGSATGDPGLSSVLAEMMADWSVLRGRLGFNNPDTYGTTVSLRNSLHRILPGEAGAENWKDILETYWRADIMTDPDVRRHAMQPDPDGFPVPGLVIPFSSTIATGRNFFGQPLLPGDSAFSPTSFATKIHSVGIALPGYVGMTDPSTNSSDIQYGGGSSPGDPQAPWLHPDGLAATPYVYLIPTGVDSMRSPPLGDAGGVRTWRVSDVTVPLPFNIGASQFSTLQWWQSSDFLSEEMFSVRKHQAFRPVSNASVFGYDLSPSQFTNSRLIGRSVWNSEWKIVIPGTTLLNDPEEGLRRLIRTLEDIQLHFITYSYSGN